MTEKIAPVQGYSAGIPWSMHLRAYDAYSKRWSPQPAMIDLEGRNCRGGFSVGELDMFIPGWRDEVSLIRRLEAENKSLRAALDAVKHGAEYPDELGDIIDAALNIQQRAEK